MGSEMPPFLVWSLCIKCLVHHEVLSLVLFMQSLYTLSNLLIFLFTCLLPFFLLLLAVTVIERKTTSRSLHR